jgi:hypothetical protein
MPLQNLHPESWRFNLRTERARFALLRDQRNRPALQQQPSCPAAPLSSSVAFRLITDRCVEGLSCAVASHICECVKPGGVVVSIGSTPSAAFARAISVMSRNATAAARAHHARYEYLFVRADGEQLREITRLVENGAIKPLVDTVFPLEHLRDALPYSESGRATGKVVIRVADRAGRLHAPIVPSVYGA